MPTATLSEPQASSSLRSEITGRVSGMKSILFYVRDDSSLEHRLQTALSMARASSAHLEFVQIVPIEAYTFVDSYGSTNISADITEALEEQAGNLRSKLEQRLRNEDVSWDYQLLTSAPTAELLGRAALNDLVILGREPRGREFTYGGFELIQHFLYGSRTPVLVPGDSSVVPNVTDTAFIGWNGSYEAANAVRSTIGLLQLASNVRVIRISEVEKEAFPDTRLLQYLSRHGIHAQLYEKEPCSDTSTNLVSYAVAGGASYLVLGGYSHSRAGEFLFGGVTRDLIRACPVSIVLAH
jgi:hypothetical protein